MKKRSNYKRSRKGDNTERYYTKEDIFISRMASILMVSKSETKSYFSQRSVTTIRINNLATNPTDIYDNLVRNGIALEEVPWAPYTYIVPNKDKSELGKIAEYDRGLFYIQNLSSILAALALDPQQGDTVLDMCAAPGSKTTYISSLTDGKSKILALEEDSQRIGKLYSVLNQFHVKNVEIKQGDGRDIGRSLPGHFDKVLLDAPCSGEGLIYLRCEKPLRFWGIKKVKRMVALQKQLILSSFDSLKKGGSMIYSTCTLEPEENEGIVSYLLDSRESAKVQDLEIISSPEFARHKPFTVPGITKWSGMSFNKECRKAVRILPNSQMQGFFICKIMK